MSKQLKVRILPDGDVLITPRGTRIKNLFQEESFLGRLPMVAVKICNKYASLQDNLRVDCTVEPVIIDSTPGMRIYRNSLIYLFELAARITFPDRRVVIGHSLGHSFFHRFRDNGPQADKKDVIAVEAAMKALVERNLPILPDEISWENAVEIFRNRLYPSTSQLMEELNEPRVGIWQCDGFITIRHNPLVADTGVLKTFSVEFYRGGFLLRYPPSQTPKTLGKQDIEPKLFDIYEEHKKWGEILDVSNVAQLNILSRNRAQAKDFIQTAEALHDRKIAEFSGLISSKKNRVKIVLIAGPSSSGKTTFTKKLALSLKSVGLKPQLISLDDYYRERTDVPLDKEGKPDFEVLEALDIELFNRNLEDLFAGKETEIPIFDFKKVGGRLEKGRKICLDENGILLFEGIHGLNPRLTPGMDKDKVFKIYISALTQLNLDDHDRIPTTDNRLIRRIVRDHQFRGYPAIETLRIWPSVRRGEELHIFPYQGSADVMFNSALDYELAILKVFAEPLLRTVSPVENEYGEARRLMSFLRNFSPFPVEDVPELSIIREFIGRSGFRY